MRIFVPSDGVVGASRSRVMFVRLSAPAGRRVWRFGGRAVCPGPAGFERGRSRVRRGLEFRAVAVVACDDDILPLQSCIESVAGPADLEDAYGMERHLLYVACTRAHLLMTGVSPASEFLDDLRCNT